MFMLKRQTIFIIGRSEIVQEINLALISELFTTLAINNSNPQLHPTYTMFLDSMPQVIKNIQDNKINTTILTTYQNASLLRQQTPAQLFQIQSVGFNAQSYMTGDKLNYCGFTHDVALSWAIQQGFKRAILLGAADFTNTHYDNSKPFNYSKNLREQSINYIENVCTKYIEIYTMNKKSVLNTPRTTLEREIDEQYRRR